MKNNAYKGQSLIEILVATGIIAVVLVGVSDLITRSLSLSTFQADKTQAVNIAQNQLNYYRGQRDLAPTAFFNNPGTACVGMSETELNKYTCLIGYVDVNGGAGKEMTVTISWNDGSKAVSTSLSQILAKPTK